MEAINYANGANMTLPPDAQIVQGVSGNAVYLPAGAGTMPIAGNRNELTISLWRQWDGVVEADDYRGFFSFKNMQVFFDNKSDFLTIALNGFKAITDVKDNQKQAHWCFVFAKNNFFKVYKNAEKVYEIAAGPEPCDLSEGFTLGGGRTHAAFDEVRMYKSVVTEPEIRGLYRLVTKGTQVQQLENIVTEAAPKYLGVVETVPDTKTAIITKGEKFGFVDANPGDWVLSGKTIGGWKVGVCYKWSGLAWKPLEPAINYAKEYHACLLHICDIEELMKETGHFGALFAKQIIAQEAFIKKLAADQAFLKELIVQRLRIDSDKNSDKDFEAWFDKRHGLKIKNNGQEIFSVDVNGFVKMKRATFEGEIKCRGFQVVNLENSSNVEKLFEWKKGATGHDCIKRIFKVNTIPFKGRSENFGETKATYYGEGQYGSDIIRVVIVSYCLAPFYEISRCFLTLISNNGTKVARIQSSQRKDGVYITWLNNNSNDRGHYLPSLHDFVFYEYKPNQKIIIPNISFGKSVEKNVLYRDENGFIKIS